MDKVNIKKLAAELNLSAATVSRALRDSHEIGAATKARVMEMARKMNYVANPSASNLRSHKSKTIAVIVPEIANSFFSQAINGIEEIARAHNYHVLIYQTHENVEAENAFIRSLLSGRVDGILISIASGTSESRNYKDVLPVLPLIFFDRVCEDIEAIKITTNDYQSSYTATKHLIENGCKKIAYLKAIDHTPAGKNRIAGYVNALKDSEILFDERLMIDTRSEQENVELIKNLLQTQKPDGLIASIEELSLPCYYACRELSLKIPTDVKIISFSNLKTAGILNPSLTTIAQPAFEMGRTAAGILFKILNRKEVELNQTLVLDSELVVRDSTQNLY
ncbi:LacI family DNA-binding transcriptional regulator [Mucilaginibacter celer]|uniref:LacI family DNA-binding transcriptional regulator n=1 Tax=Mucilaginibacter celer TaxID=2305508 RepID=A0A494VYV1_9SPHI|nr:LacI family DNA-binding transcriptional regulator [Mucilaginibacter celer]AYL96172.1 LacI family DNA-binding transcriptional regulator [Mucilaginibacter celer]